MLTATNLIHHTGEQNGKSPPNTMVNAVLEQQVIYVILRNSVPTIAGRYVLI